MAQGLLKGGVSHGSASLGEREQPTGPSVLWERWIWGELGKGGWKDEMLRELLLGRK